MVVCPWQSPCRGLSDDGRVSFREAWCCVRPGEIDFFAIRRRKSGSSALLGF